jgi:hypothetical protein
MATWLWWSLLGAAGLLALLMHRGAVDLRSFKARVPRATTLDDLLLYQALISRQMKLAILTLVIAGVGVLGWGWAWTHIAIRPQMHWWIPGGAWLIVTLWAWLQRGQEKAIWRTECDGALIQDRWSRLSHIWRRYFWPRFDRALVTEATEWQAPGPDGSGTPLSP